LWIFQATCQQNAVPAVSDQAKCFQKDSPLGSSRNLLLLRLKSLNAEKKRSEIIHQGITAIKTKRRSANGVKICHFQRQWQIMWCSADWFVLSTAQRVAAFLHPLATFWYPHINTSLNHST